MKFWFIVLKKTFLLSLFAKIIVYNQIKLGHLVIDRPLNKRNLNANINYINTCISYCLGTF